MTKDKMFHNICTTKKKTKNELTVPLALFCVWLHDIILSLIVFYYF